MLTVIFVMIAGMVAGYALRKRQFKHLQAVITVVIWMLLFSLGTGIGSDSKLMNSLGTLGMEATIISVSCILGSVLSAWLLWRVCVKKNGK